MGAPRPVDCRLGGGHELSRESAERYDINAREDLSSEARVRRFNHNGGCEASHEL